MAFWTDEILSVVDGGQEQLLNDSKTPSGRVHVGSLRGVMIHDAIRRTLAENGTPVVFSYGVDDYDPLDELPAGLADFYRPHLGKPLCNVPPPPGSHATDIAEYYIGEFFEVFSYLGVETTTYRMRDVYRSGQFDSAIAIVLEHADAVRRIYLDVSGARRDPDWLPFQVICPVCGRIGTSVVSDFDGETVHYECRPDLVSWATGCGSSGRASPFKGGGKLPWKLEWTAKWATFGVTIEGAGKDHMVRGGSHDVAAACLRQIFHKEPPLNVPYEFFLVGGAKMSSSKGLGVSAKEMADFLPSDVLRFLLVRTRPRSAVNFEPTEAEVVKLYSDFDKCRAEAIKDPTGTLAKVYRLSSDEPPEYWAPAMGLVIALEQLPHIDVEDRVAALKGEPLTPSELSHLSDRRKAARYWLDHFASAEEKLELAPALPSRAGELTAAQRVFLGELAAVLSESPWEAEAIQNDIFTVARSTGLEAPAAFTALYLSFFNRSSGPRAGSVLSFLDRAFVAERLRASSAASTGH